ncbi:MAG TPA: GIY-YIG nuclease family protein [Stellaceae bacterium]|nr:GIY-YIG nuclease family protein [Stellaceae bacterium]
MPYYVYLLASRKHGTVYIGVTNDLQRRIHEHKAKVGGGFTAKYDVNRLVWFEVHDDVTAAILREKKLKKWRRDWKIELIERQNPDWSDLSESFNQPPTPVIPEPPAGRDPEPKNTAS